MLRFWGGGTAEDCSESDEGGAEKEERAERFSIDEAEQDSGGDGDEIGQKCQKVDGASFHGEFPPEIAEADRADAAGDGEEEGEGIDGAPIVADGGEAGGENGADEELEGGAPLLVGDFPMAEQDGIERPEKGADQRQQMRQVGCQGARRKIEPLCEGDANEAEECAEKHWCEAWTGTQEEDA